MMKKFLIFFLGLQIFVLNNLMFASELSNNQIDNFSKKLDTNKELLLKNLEKSIEKLQSVAKETSAITETTLFKATTCLGAISGENEDLNYYTLISGLQENILNEYIKLDGDIKRLSFGLVTEDPIVFESSLDTYYNQNSQKITDLESEYYKKAMNMKDTFLEYVNNNSEILNGLAIKLDAFYKIQNAVKDVSLALEDFSGAINKKSTLFTDLENLRVQSEENYEAQLDAIISENIDANHPNSEILSQYYVNKDNFLKKYKTEIKKSEYYLFSALFSYETYKNLLDKKANVDRQFTTSGININCSDLLTTNFNIGSYAKDVDVISEKLVNGLKLLTNAINDGRIDLSILEKPTVSYFQNDCKKLTRDLTKSFRNMLESLVPVAKEESNKAENSESSGETSLPTVTFTQAFKKNQYYEDVKVLQSILKNWGYYDGEISGVYSPATIEAVYHFQLKEGIISGNENDKSAYGWFGTATRARMNSLLQQ